MRQIYYLVIAIVVCSMLVFSVSAADITPSIKTTDKTYGSAFKVPTIKPSIKSTSKTYDGSGVFKLPTVKY